MQVSSTSLAKKGSKLICRAFCRCCVKSSSHLLWINAKELVIFRLPFYPLMLIFFEMFELGGPYKIIGIDFWIEVTPMI